MKGNCRHSGEQICLHTFGIRGLRVSRGRGRGPLGRTEEAEHLVLDSSLHVTLDSEVNDGHHQGILMAGGCAMVACVLHQSQGLRLYVSPGPTGGLNESAANLEPG